MSTFAPNYVVFIIGRFFLGMGSIAVYMTSYVLSQYYFTSYNVLFAVQITLLLNACRNLPEIQSCLVTWTYDDIRGPAFTRSVLFRIVSLLAQYLLPAL
jgi:hypothetical protein